MKNLMRVIVFRKRFDEGAFFRLVRITLSGYDNTKRNARIPRKFGLIQFPVKGKKQGLGKVSLKATHNRLGLRISEAAVKFQRFHAARFVNHQTGIKESRVRMTFFFHAAHGRINNLVQDFFVDGLGYHRSRRVGAHAARVRTLVSVQKPLMVLA